MNHNKLIKFVTLTLCVLFVIFVLFVVFFLRVHDDPSAISSTTNNIASDLSSNNQTANDQSNNVSSTTTNNSEIDNNSSEDTLINDNDNNDTINKENIKPGSEDADDYWTLDPDTIIVEWSEVKYPKKKMQGLIDRMARANTILNQTTGEDVFDTPMKKISTPGMLVYVSEYGKKDVFAQRVLPDGDRQYVSYPNAVIFGFAFLMGSAYDSTLMNRYQDGCTMWHDDAVNSAFYYFPEKEPKVKNSFKFISCAENSAGHVEMLVSGKGKYAGSNYVLTVNHQFEDIWIILSLKKVNEKESK